MHSPEQSQTKKKITWVNKIPVICIVYAKQTTRRTTKDNKKHSIENDDKATTTKDSSNEPASLWLQKKKASDF